MKFAVRLMFSILCVLAVEGDGEIHHTDPWTECSVTCGTGIQMQRVWICVDVPDRPACAMAIAKTQYQFCNTHLCPGFTPALEHSPWGLCSVTCGQGMKRRKTYRIMNQDGTRKELRSTDVASCDAGPCPTHIYLVESGGAPSGGYITSLSLSTGVQTRLAPSGGAYEKGVAVDIKTNTIYYSMTLPNSVWRADLSNINTTKTQIWTAPTNPIGLALSTLDQLIFVDQWSSGMVLIDYGVTMTATLAVSKGISYGIAVDQTARILYFADGNNAQILKASYSPTGWIGSATVILIGTGVGQAGSGPIGLVLEAGVLYWNLWNSGEIRCMSTTGSSSQTVVPSALTSVSVHGLAKNGPTFYYTRNAYDGGIWQVNATGTATKITANTTLWTAGLTLG